MFFPLLEIVLDLPILVPFSASAVFLFHLFHVSKTFLFEDIFHPGKQTKKKMLGVKSGE